MSRDSNKEMTRLNFEFKKQFSAVTEDHARWRECVGNTGYLTFAVGYMYVKKHFGDEAKTKVTSSSFVKSRQKTDKFFFL